MTLCLVLALGLASTSAEPEDWRYVLPAPGDAFEHPPLRSIGLRPQGPGDVVEKVAYRGTRRRYAQLRYGSPGSVRVTVVLDEAATGRADLYVDADRNRRIEVRDRVTPAADGRTWRVPLDVAVVDGETVRHERRAYVFRLGASGLGFSGAAAGYFEGSVTVAGRRHAARRADGDGNGRLADPQDRLWVDLDGDGRWDPVDEQFLFASVFSLAGARHTARSDEYGHRLALVPLEGTGTIRLAGARPGTSVAELSATLIGRDGSAISLTGAGAMAEVPVGDYRLGTVAVALDDPAGGPRWGYVFSDSGRRGEAVWHTVEKGGLAAIDAIGTPALEAGVEGVDPRRPGEDLSLRPRLYTGDGLLIVTCYRGTPAMPASDDGPVALVALCDRGGRALATSRSGFA